MLRVPLCQFLAKNLHGGEKLRAAEIALTTLPGDLPGKVQDWLAAVPQLAVSSSTADIQLSPNQSLPCLAGLRKPINPDTICVLIKLTREKHIRKHFVAVRRIFLEAPLGNEISLPCSYEAGR